MNDIKVIVIKDILPVNRVSFVPNFTPLSLSIEGSLLLQANEVLINDINAPEFMIVSDKKLVAQVPDSQVNSRLRSVTVLATKPSADRSSILHLDAGKTFSGLKGLEKLIQYFVKVLLQNPGSDIFNPTLGGGVLGLVGRVVSKKDSSALSASLVSSVNQTRDQIIKQQGQINRLPSDERLLRADTQAVGFNPNTTTLAARISIGAVSGRTAVANLTF
jgi:hypothetical protein